MAPADPALKSYELPMPGFAEVLAMRFEECLPWQGYLRAQGYDLPPYARFYHPVPAPDRAPRIDDPAFDAAQHSDTAFLTDRLPEDIAMRDLHPWCALLTYIRPHPPFVAPAPWNRLVDPAVLRPGKTLPIRLHSLCSWPGSAWARSTSPALSWNTTPPPMGSIARRIARPTVVLHEPDSPTNASVRPRPTAKLMPWIVVIGPSSVRKAMVSSATSRIGSMPTPFSARFGIGGGLRAAPRR
jgi:hypothetical protein